MSILVLFKPLFLYTFKISISIFLLLKSAIYFLKSSIFKYIFFKICYKIEIIVHKLKTKNKVNEKQSIIYLFMMKKLVKYNIFILLYTLLNCETNYLISWVFIHQSHLSFKCMCESIPLTNVVMYYE